MRTATTCLPLLATFLLACAEKEPSAEDPARSGNPWFEECAVQRGLDFRHVSGHRPDEYLFPEIMGGGAALADLDGDGDLDAYLVQSGSLHPDAPASPPNMLFRNEGDGRFVDVTAASGAGDRGYGMGVALGDVENDGDLDLYVTNVGPNVLLANDGGGSFTDVTDAAGVGEERWSVSAAFFDVENDGDHDLFVVNYVRWSLADERPCEQLALGLDYCSPKAYRAPAPDTFYVNQGAGRFAERSSEAGLRTTFGNGLGVLCMDFDADGWTDVFVANDGTINQLWRNQGDGTFVDEALLRGVGVDMDGAAKAGMGVAAADLDDDGDEELLVVNLSGETDSFYRNEGEYFSDRTALAGLGQASRGYTRFGVAFLDFDNDGLLDLYEANGRVARAAEPRVEDPYAEENLLFRQSEPGRFQEVLPRGGTAAAFVATSRAAAFGDVDGDGGLDVLVVNRDERAHLFRNVVADRGGWVRLVVTEADGTPALGARLRLRVADRTRTRVVRSAFSYDAASDPAVHVGLGGAARVEEVLVRWADGSQERYGPLDGGTGHVLVRGAGR